MEAMRKDVARTFRMYRKDKITSKDWWEFIREGREKNEEAFNDVLAKTLDYHRKVEKRLRAYLKSPLYQFKIRKYCNQHLSSDIEPFEVIKVINSKRVLLRRMDAELIQPPKEFHPGGFSGNYSDNNSQRWECKSNPENESFEIRLSMYGWGRGRYIMSDEPIKFYDYNF